MSHRARPTTPSATASLRPRLLLCSAIIAAVALAACADVTAPVESTGMSRRPNRGAVVEKQGGGAAWGDTLSGDTTRAGSQSSGDKGFWW